MNTFSPRRTVPDTVLQQWTPRLGTFFLVLAFHTAEGEKVRGCRLEAHILRTQSAKADSAWRRPLCSASAADDIYGAQKRAGNMPVHSSLCRKLSGYPEAIRSFVWQFNTVGGHLK